jgi:hypothetical protein
VIAGEKPPLNYDDCFLEFGMWNMELKLLGTVNEYFKQKSGTRNQESGEIARIAT